MNLFFLPAELRVAITNLNYNFLNEIRLRYGQAVIIQYAGEYKYINKFGLNEREANAIICADPQRVLSTALEGSVYAYTEQLRHGYVTIGNGIRIGIAGEYVCTGDNVTAIKNVTSLNVRIPHECDGCGLELFNFICGRGIVNTLIFSPPGLGKTTLLRSIAKFISNNCGVNVLVFDERNEISATDGAHMGFDLGVRCDVVRGADKLTAFSSAIRAMRPQVIICDELYGENDVKAVSYATECGISVIASSHTCNREKLSLLPFEYFVELTGIAKQAVIYDKTFNIIGYCNTVGGAWDSVFK